MLTHKGYMGHVEYDDEGKIFIGHIINTRDEVTFQGHNPKELEKSFRDSLEFYFEMCRRKNKKPEKPTSGHITLRTDPILHSLFVYHAKKENKNLNKWAIDVLKENIEVDAPRR